MIVCAVCMSSSNVGGCSGKDLSCMPYSSIHSLPESTIKSLFMEAYSISNIGNANDVVIYEIVKFFKYSPKHQHFFRTL